MNTLKMFYIEDVSIYALVNPADNQDGDAFQKSGYIVALLTPISIPFSSVVLLGGFILFSSLLLVFFMREGWLS